MKKNATPLVDELVQSIQPVREAATDEFFYTRLLARMEKNRESNGWNLPLKPVWVISSLVLLLIMNWFVIVKQSQPNTSPTASTSPLQSFAASYDQTVSSSY